MANINATVLYKDFDVNLINFEPVSKNKMGGKMVRVTYGPTKQPIRIQSPNIYMPFGVSTYTDEKTGETSHSIDAAFRGYQEDVKVKKFYDLMNAIDEKIVKTCVERSTEWLGKAMSIEVVREFFRPLVRPPKDEKYSPLLKIKVAPLNRSGQMPKVFDVADVSEPRDLSFILKGSVAAVILTIPMVWFVNKTFGVSAKLFQAAVVSRPVVTESFAFTPEDPDEYTEDNKGFAFDDGDL